MKYLFLFCTLLILVSACDSSRVFENYTEFKDRSWKVQEPVTFEFVISDSTKNYNVYYNIRNTLDYPYARVFTDYVVLDSTNTRLAGKLVSNYLFDQKTGSPMGRSGLGDVYDHRFLLLENFSFRTGKYKIRLEQFNREDTLAGILAVGVRVETAELD